MFTNRGAILAYLEANRYPVDYLSYINIGVMTDKYEFRSGGRRYIVRCYPDKRGWLAETEYHYLKLFRRIGVKVPRVCQYNKESPSLIIYEKLSGDTLDKVYGSLSYEERDIICKEIVDNYKKISNVLCKGYGMMTGFERFSSDSWSNFLESELLKAKNNLEKKGDSLKVRVAQGMINFLKAIHVDKGHLVWSDFSTQNIIVRDKHLAGFIDIEGLMAGDPLLGLGYLIAHEGQSDLVRRLFRCYNIKGKEQTIDFYAVLRFMRLCPYLDDKLPNGTEREPISTYLPYSFQKMTSFIFTL